MEEKKSRRPGLQTTVRRIPSEAVKTTKNNRASQLSKQASSDRDGRKRAAAGKNDAGQKKAGPGMSAEKQAEELTRASLKASRKLKDAIRISLPEDLKKQTGVLASSKPAEKPGDACPAEAKRQSAENVAATVPDVETAVSDISKTDDIPEKEDSFENKEDSDNKAESGDKEPDENAAPKGQSEEQPKEQSEGQPSKPETKKSGFTFGHLKKSGKSLTHNLVRAGKVLTKPSAENELERRQKRVYKQRLIIFLIAAAFGVFLITCAYHAFHFQNRTYVNGVNVSGLSVKEAAKKMEAESKNYSITITADGGVRDEIKDSALSVKVTNTSGIKKALKKQNPFTWISGGLHKKNITAKISASYDNDRLKEDIAALSILQEDNMTAPVDASLKETDDGQYQIEKETIGSTFDVDEAAALIEAAVGNYQRTVNISESQEHPKVYSSSENLAERMNTWNTFLKAAGISYNFPAKTVSLDAKDIASLLSDDGNEVTVSYDKVAALMADWRETYDTYNNSFEFTTVKGETIKTWYEGDYGFELDEEDTAKDLIANIKAGDTGNHDPKWFHEGNSMDNMGLGDTYVEISIEDQHLWVHKDGEIVVDTDVVTGNPNPDSEGRNRETYKGCYSIKGKYEDVTLGTIEVQGYASPVNYWVPFNGGEGLHDAPWRDEFGGSIYQSNGSHGCVNCPEDMMGKIFANVEKGEAVIIY